MPIQISNAGVGGVGGGGSARTKVTHRQVAATDSETQITLATNAQFMTIQNIGTSLAYIGGTGVTTNAYSHLLYPRGSYDFGACASGFNFYVIMPSAGTTTIGVLEDA